MPYTRAQLLNAFRQDHPELAKIDDNRLFAAIAQDSPDLVKGASEYQQPAPQAPDDRNWWQVAVDQTKQVGGGIYDAAAGIPAGIAELIKLNASGPIPQLKFLKDTAAGLYDTVTAPVKPIMKTVAPGTFGEATREDWEHGARASGNNAAQLAMVKGGEVASKATPEALQDIATRARMYRAAHPSPLAALAETDLSHPLSALQTVPEAARATAGAVAGKVVAPAAELAAKAKIAMGAKAPQRVTTPAPQIDPLESIKQNAAPAAADPIAANYERTRNILSTEMEPKPYTAPPEPTPVDAMYQKIQGTPIDVPTEVPELPNEAAVLERRAAVQQEGVPQYTGPNRRMTQLGPEGVVSEVNGPSPLDGKEPYVRGSVKREPVTEIAGPNGQPQYPNGEPPLTPPPAGEEPTFGVNTFHETPMVEQMQAPVEPPPMEAPAMQAPVEAQPMAQAPVEGPPQIPAEVQMTMDALLRRGKGASGADLAMTNAQYLHEVMPEIKGVPGGPKFDRMLTDKLNTVGTAIDAKMQSIPGDRPVATLEARARLTELADNAATSYDNASATKLKKLADLLDEGGSTPWEKVWKIRRNLNDSGLDISSGIGKEAYKVFKDLTEKVDPSLKELNSRYYTLKTASELAEIRTGGPSPQSQLGTGTRPKADFRDRITAEQEAVKAQEAAKKAADKAASDAAKNAEAARKAAEKTAEKNAKAAADAQKQAAKEARIKAAREAMAKFKAEESAKKAAKAAEDAKLKAAEREKAQRLKRGEKLATPSRGSGHFRGGPL